MPAPVFHHSGTICRKVWEGVGHPPGRSHSGTFWQETQGEKTLIAILASW